MVSPDIQSPVPNPQSGPHQQSRLAYLLPEPYRRICLEIDAVEGAQPAEQAIRSFVAFLEDHCRKPVILRQKAPIPLEHARGQRQQLLALDNMTGPVTGDQRPAAYLYILFYNSSVLTPATRSRQDQRPYVSPKCPYVIFVDTAYFWLLRPRRLTLSRVLKHEAAHILGLADDPTHARNHHCRNRDCVVRNGFSIPRLLLGFEADDLCKDCRDDLAEARHAVPATNMKFAGPFLLRQEDAYLVAMAPGYLVLKLQSPDAFDCQAELTKARSLVERAKPGHFVSTYDHGVLNHENIMMKQQAAVAAMGDSDPTVAKLARHIAEALKGISGSPSSEDDRLGQP